MAASRKGEQKKALSTFGMRLMVFNKKYQVRGYTKHGRYLPAHAELPVE
jgi:hypothetical protein